MATSPATPQVLWETIQRLRADRWPAALEALESLTTAVETPSLEAGKIIIGADVLKSPLVGIWKDRTDIKSTREFADELRQRSESRNFGK